MDSGTRGGGKSNETDFFLILQKDDPAQGTSRKHEPLPQGSINILSMKHFWLYCGMAALAVSCGDSGDDPGPRPAKTLPLTVRISGGSYTEAADAGTAGKEYPVTLAEGSAAGLFVVHADGTSADPVKLTLGAGGVWSAAQGELPEYTEGDRYFACYPFEAAGKDDVEVSATTDDAFFAAPIAGYKPAADQSEGYAASALMTAAGKVTATETSATLELRMTPRTALAVLTMPATKYIFDNEPALPDYVVPATNVSFDGFTPYTAEDGSYLYSVNPAEAPVLKGSYGDGQQWTQETSGATAGKWTSYAVNGGTVEKSHTLRIGDFFLANGNLLSKDAEASEVAAAHVVGIVFQTDPERIDAADKEALGGAAHGVVIATKSAEPAAWYTRKDRDESEIGIAPFFSEEDDLRTTAQKTDACIRGYYYTRQILTERTSDVGKGQYPIFAAMESFAATAGGPAEEVATTGWYLPAIGQWFDVMRNLVGAELSADNVTDYGGGTYYYPQEEKPLDVHKLLNEAMKKVSVENKTEYPEDDNSAFYYCSSVLSTSGAHVFSPNRGVGTFRFNIMSGAKDNRYDARAMLTF